MEGHGIKAEWVEGVPGCPGSTVLMVSSNLGQIAFTAGQASVLVAEISNRPKLLDNLQFKRKPFLVGQGESNVGN